MRTLIVLFLAAFLLSSCDDGDPVATLAVLSTQEISMLTKTSAVSGGSITSDGGSTIFNRGICYSTSSSPTIENNVIPNAGGTGSFTVAMANLVEGTTYHVRAYAMNSAGTSYGNEITFTTITSTAPVVTTAAVSQITFKTAVSGGEVSSDGGAPVTVKGICFSVSENPTTADQLVTSGSGQGSFVANLSGLTAGTQYHIRAFATNAVGTSYGSDVTFTTPPAVIPTLTTKEVSLITASSAISGGEIISIGGASITENGIVWSTSPNPTISDNKITHAVDENFEISMTGLTRTTTYYVRAFATNSAGTGYGSEKTFSTPGLAVGDEYQGGIIYFLDPAGTSGLIVAKNDLPDSPWGCENVGISTSSEVGTADENTANILAGCSEAGTAARLCSDLISEGYDDWVLPSLNDLKLIYANLISHGIGNFAPSGNYWSSTQLSDFYAEGYDVRHTSPFMSQKSWIFSVRPVRSF